MPTADPISDYVITPHARWAMQRRGIDETVVRSILHSPEQRVVVGPSRDVLQSRIMLEDRRFLVRVFLDVATRPAEVVTVYRTSKINKYWNDET